MLDDLLTNIFDAALHEAIRNFGKADANFKVRPMPILPILKGISETPQHLDQYQQVWAEFNNSWRRVINVSDFNAHLQKENSPIRLAMFDEDMIAFDFVKKSIR